MKAVITGGCGFIGSHASIRLANEGWEVLIIDNLSRAALLGKSPKNSRYNLDYISQRPQLKTGKKGTIQVVIGDICDQKLLEKNFEGADLIIHTAAQTAVTSSVKDPYEDFKNNALGSFLICETARKTGNNPVLIFASTNKVYGSNVNEIPVIQQKNRYIFDYNSDYIKNYNKKTGGEEQFFTGINEKFNIDQCEHSPYGCSKLTADLYFQEYANIYGLKTGIFRMSCIYGTHQFGFEDQGWVAWLTIAALKDKNISIYGDGKQIRDLLWVDDLISAWLLFYHSHIKHGVYNIGGGHENTLSLLELLDILEDYTKRKIKKTFCPWRPGDQKIYVSDIQKVSSALSWKPQISPEEGVKKLISWVSDNLEIF